MFVEIINEWWWVAAVFMGILTIAISTARLQN
jgi:hypothetical protein